MKKKYTPHNDRILIRKKLAPDTAGTPDAPVIIPHQAKEAPAEGVVVAVGPGIRNPDAPAIRMGVMYSPGDYVMYSKYAGTEVEIEGEAHIFVREAEILCAVEETG